eukprot:gnl/MRDRNA2_/MRDRNA2_193827_c0_seq1.p1 gnl/MRDRNA2_/MRDRNA2_193827_c0~~gnl/MRDRNA2_/MRDRNA2_193827_c0_seq1.p1  ORF type:complete len:281 (+),score=32.87 gnl/MRDRNA2_/MRDRNA2_193827_c0_seq1:97-843(+)
MPADVGQRRSSIEEFLDSRNIPAPPPMPDMSSLDNDFLSTRFQRVPPPPSAPAGTAQIFPVLSSTAGLSPFKDCPALRIPLPTLPGGQNFNVEKCLLGVTCEDKVCQRFHSEDERRCPFFASGKCAPRPDGSPCQVGLHVMPEEVNQIYWLDLNSPSHRLQLRDVEEMTVARRATYIRIVICGYCQLLRPTATLFLRKFPLLFEICLPDWNWNPDLLICLCDLVEPLAQECPRLRNVIFSDGTQDALW